MSADEDVDAAAEAARADTPAEMPDAPAPLVTGRRRSWLSIVAFAVLPALAVVLAGTVAYLSWQGSQRRDAQAAVAESVTAARDATAAILSYRAESVEADLNAVRGRLTGDFLDSYTTLINDVVIPAAREKKITAAAQVAAAASVSATPTHAVVLAFVDQSVTMGGGAPTTTPSSVRVTLDKVDGSWLVSGFDPI